MASLPSDGTEEQYTFNNALSEAFRSEPMRSEIWQCVDLILELRYIAYGTLSFQILYRRQGDEFQIDVQGVETDSLSPEEADCFLQYLQDPSNLPVPGWIPDGGELLISVPVYFGITGEPY